MGQLESTGIKSADNPQRFPNDNVAASFPHDLGLESIYDPCVFETLDALRETAFENAGKGPLVVVGREHLCLSLAWVAECPSLFIKGLFLVVCAASRHG